MKRIFFIFFLLFQTPNLFSQARFNRVYRLDSAQYLATLFFSMRIVDNKIYTAGTCTVPLDSTTSGRFVNSGILTRLDMSGNIEKNNYYRQGRENCFFFNDLMVMDKDKINLVGTSFDSSLTYLKTNYNGDQIIRKKYYPNNFPTSFYNTPASVIKFNNSYAFTTYKFFSTQTPTQTSVIVIDTLGTVIKTFDFSADQLNCGPGTILVNKNKNLVFNTSQTFGNETDSGFVYISRVREIDSSGTTLWSYSTPASRYLFCDNFVQLPNNNYLIWGTEELATVFYNGVRWVRTTSGGGPYLAEINPQRGLVWEKRFGIRGRLRGLKVLRDSSIALTGSYDDRNHTSAFLLRLNSRGDSLYRRNFRNARFETVYYRQNQIEELNNGDLLISGYILNDIPLTEPGAGHWGWLVRTDSLGCSLEPSSCRVPTKEVENDPLSIKVFPNPVNEQMTIDYQFIKPQISTYIEIVDILGRAVFRQKIDDAQGQMQWQTNFAASGLYIVNVKSDNQILWQTKVSVQK